MTNENRIYEGFGIVELRGFAQEWHTADDTSYTYLASRGVIRNT